MLPLVVAGLAAEFGVRLAWPGDAVPLVVGGVPAAGGAGERLELVVLVVLLLLPSLGTALLLDLRVEPTSLRKREFIDLGCNALSGTGASG